MQSCSQHGILHVKMLCRGLPKAGSTRRRPQQLPLRRPKMVGPSSSHACLFGPAVLGWLNHSDANSAGSPRQGFTTHMQSCSSCARAGRDGLPLSPVGHAAADANAKTIIADWLMEKALPVLAAVDGGQLAVEYMGFIEQASLWQLQQHQKAGKSLRLACKLSCCSSRPCVAATTAP